MQYADIEVGHEYMYQGGPVRVIATRVIVNSPADEQAFATIQLPVTKTTMVVATWELRPLPLAPKRIPGDAEIYGHP